MKAQIVERATKWKRGAKKHKLNELEQRNLTRPDSDSHSKKETLLCSSSMPMDNRNLERPQGYGDDDHDNDNSGSDDEFDLNDDGAAHALLSQNTQTRRQSKQAGATHRHDRRVSSSSKARRTELRVQAPGSLRRQRRELLRYSKRTKVAPVSPQKKTGAIEQTLDNGRPHTVHNDD